MEIWKSIPGHDHYEVSSAGRVRSVDRVVPYVANGKAKSSKSLKGKVLKQTKNAVNGYLYVHLGRGKISTVHALVALAFIGCRPKGAMVLHKDGNRENNSSENLEYGSSLENRKDSIKHGTACFGESHPQSKLTASQVLEMRFRAKGGEPVSRLALEFGVSYLTARNVVNRVTWRWLDENN